MQGRSCALDPSLGDSRRPRPSHHHPCPTCLQSLYDKMDEWTKLGRLRFPTSLFAYPFYLARRSPGKKGSHYDPECDLFVPRWAPPGRRAAVQAWQAAGSGAQAARWAALLAAGALSRSACGLAADPASCRSASPHPALPPPRPCRLGTP